MESKVIWYISKYAWTPSNRIVSRQFNYSKYFAKKGHVAYLFSSISCGHETDLSGYQDRGYYYYKKLEDVNHILVKGPIINLGFNVKRILSWLIFEWNLRRIVKTEKLDKPNSIIVSSLSILTIINGILFKRSFKSKLIFEIRDIWPLTLVDIGGVSRWNPIVFLLRRLELFGYRNADIIVGSMPKLDDHIKSSIGSNFKFEWLPTGVDVEESSVAELPNMIARQIPKNKFIAAYTGAIGKVNCVHEIVEAARFLQENYNIHFIILGNGPLKQALVEQAMDLDNVTFIDKIDKMYVQTFLSYCSALLHPVMDKKIYNYGISPNKWIDYMLSGKPIIVPYNGYPSLINQANCGVFIQAGNPKMLSEEILKFSQISGDELNAMGLRGRDYVLQNLNYDILSDQYLKIV